MPSFPYPAHPIHRRTLPPQDESHRSTQRAAIPEDPGARCRKYLSTVRIDRSMERSTALVLAGIALLIAAAALPFAGLALTQWDTDYVYSVETAESYCADVVHGTPDVEGTDDYRVAHENLSATGRQHVERALAVGRYVVENESAAAPDFQFTDDHVAPGEGCYAVSDEGETHALRTSRESERVGPAAGRWPGLVGRLLVVLGAGSLVAGVGLAAKRRLG